jgi:hypothetical protein
VHVSSTMPGGGSRARTPAADCHRYIGSTPHQHSPGDSCIVVALPPTDVEPRTVFTLTVRTTAVTRPPNAPVGEGRSNLCVCINGFRLGLARGSA